jgi:hypothetical protein
MAAYDGVKKMERNPVIFYLTVPTRSTSISSSNKTEVKFDDEQAMLF